MRVNQQGGIVPATLFCHSLRYRHAEKSNTMFCEKFVHIPSFINLERGTKLFAQRLGSSGEITLVLDHRCHYSTTVCINRSCVVLYQLPFFVQAARYSLEFCHVNFINNYRFTGCFFVTASLILQNGTTYERILSFAARQIAFASYTNTMYHPMEQNGTPWYSTLRKHKVMSTAHHLHPVPIRLPSSPFSFHPHIELYNRHNQNQPLVKKLIIAVIQSHII